ncbi:MAG: hypothetical protein SV775_02870 [Thermodesulfobacteriota bacterium]|nr:hypothetical protein [Thermodesulfobacteriota bacterium]
MWPEVFSDQGRKEISLLEDLERETVVFVAYGILTQLEKPGFDETTPDE